MSKRTKLKVFSQHVDAYTKGRHTGLIISEAIKAEGAKGSLINHSEHKVVLKQILDTIKLTKKNNLKLIACISDFNNLKKIKKLKPFAIAYEEPDLISSGRSITNANPINVKKFSKELKNSGVKALCGAGISTKEDIIKAKELGCDGVLVSSAIVKYKKLELLK